MTTPAFDLTLAEAGAPGRPGGRTVLVVHGGGGAATVAPLAAHLAERHHVLAPTLPGWRPLPGQRHRDDPDDRDDPDARDDPDHRAGAAMSAPAPGQPFVTAAADSQDHWSRGALWSVLVSGAATRGDSTMIEQLVPAGNGAPLHVHERLHECFYVITGEVRFQVGDQLVTATTGAAVSVPPGTPHGFVVASRTARVLNTYTPGGLDDRLAHLATAATAKTLPPAGAVLDEASAEQEAGFEARLRELHSERFADSAGGGAGADGDALVDLLADQRT